MSEAEAKSVRQRFIATRTGKYLDTIILLAQYAFLCSGLFALFFATTRAPSYFWSEGTWPGSIADYWGARIYPGYYESLESALILLSITLFIYPIRLWFDNITERPRNLNLYIGLLLPNLITFGQPGGTFYYQTVGFSLTGIVTPLYTFTFSGFGGARIILPLVWHLLFIASLIFFILGIVQIFAFRLLEKRRIGVGLFLIPVIVSLLLSILLLGNIFPYGNINPDFVQVCIPIPVLTIGVLVKACGVRIARKSN